MHAGGCNGRIQRVRCTCGAADPRPPPARQVVEEEVVRVVHQPVATAKQYLGIRMPSAIVPWHEPSGKNPRCGCERAGVSGE
jgi:hypothetical protein